MAPHLIGILGPPGSGKSRAARTVMTLGKTAVGVTDPKEVAFYGGGPNVTLFQDRGWRPHMKAWNATAISEYFRWVMARQADDTAFIVTDPASGLSDLIVHDVLKMAQVPDLMDVGYGKAHASHDRVFTDIINEWNIAFAKGKTVVATFHTHMKELAGAGEARTVKSLNKDAFGADLTELEFEERMLPVVATKLRQHIARWFDLWLYTYTTGVGANTQYWLTALPDNVRPAKHSVTWKKGVNPAKLPNDLQVVLASIEEPSSTAKEG